MIKSCIFLLFLSAVFVSAKVSYKGYQVIRAQPLNTDERTFLRELGDFYNLRFWKEPERSFGQVDILVAEDKLEVVKEFLLFKKISYYVMIEDVEEAILAQVSSRTNKISAEGFDYERYHTFDELQAWMGEIAMAHSEHVTRMEVGTSLEKRTFHALKISSGGTDKPAFAIDCGIHACEWIGPATCTNVVKFLIEEIGKDTRVGQILKSVDFYIIPSSNPDGYSYTWTKDRLWRKTRSHHSQNASCVGVDPNRNWDSNFGGNGSSNDPCSDSYHGPEAWSELNVRAQRDFVNGIKNLQAYIDVHSYSQLWMFPYGFTFDHPRDYELLSTIANASAKAIKEVHNKTYTPGQIAKVIYVASGSTADYFYDHLKLKCVFAAELRDTGKYGMLLPEYEILPTAQEAFVGLMEIAHNVADGKCAHK